MFLLSLLMLNKSTVFKKKKKNHADPKLLNDIVYINVNLCFNISIFLAVS